MINKKYISKDAIRIVFVVFISLILILGYFFPIQEELSPGEVKLTEISPCLLKGNKWAPMDTFRRTENISICAQLSSELPTTELYYYLFSDKQKKPIFADADEYPNGSIRIIVPFYLDPGNYKFEIRWGRQVLGTVMFIVD